MKKLLSILLAGVLLFSMVACGGDSGTSGGEQSTIDKIQAQKKLVVGTAPGYLPFEMKDVNGNFVGYDVDLATAIAEAIGVEVEFKQYDFSGLIPALQTGDIDMVIAAMTIRGDRALAVSFSEPYYATGQVLMVPSADKTTTSWKDLDVAGKKIATSQGTTGALLSRQLFQNAEIVDFPDFPTASLAIMQGKADGILYDDPGVKMYEIMNPDAVRGIYDIISAENLGIVVKNNDQETIQWLNSFLYGYRNSPQDMASKDKWFNSTEWMTTIQESE